jgi:hypothetical protein
MSEARAPRIGFSALRDDLTRPDARRRFGHYAKRRGIPFEVARPEAAYDLVVSTMGGDLSVWSALPKPTRLVLDFVDSYFAVPRDDLKARARGAAKFLLGHTRRLHLDYRALMQAACRRADAVVCCTEEQRQSILPYCANVHPILDFQPEAEFVTKTSYARRDVFNLIWEGLPQNLEAFATLSGALRELRGRRSFAVHLVTDLERARGSTHALMQPTLNWVRELFRMDGVYLYQWNEPLFAAVCTACDLAVIPLRLDDPFAAGKSENKLILFWRMGLPVVTSATPAYRRSMEGAGLDMTCVTAEDWIRWIERCMDDEELRRAAGTAGRTYALRGHGEARLLERWDAALASVGVPIPTRPA